MIILLALYIAIALAVFAFLMLRLRGKNRIIEMHYGDFVALAFTLSLLWFTLLTPAIFKLAQHVQKRFAIIQSSIKLRGIYETFTKR